MVETPELWLIKYYIILHKVNLKQLNYNLWFIKICRKKKGLPFRLSGDDDSISRTELLVPVLRSMVYVLLETVARDHEELTSCLTEWRCDDGGSDVISRGNRAQIDALTNREIT